MGIGSKLKEFWENSKRVMNISYKPTNADFSRTAKIILLGIAILGVSGFIIGTIIYFITTGTLI